MSSAPTLEVPGYQVIQFLGSGARSTIWQVRDRQTEQVLALKRVVKRHATDSRFLEQAINEHNVGSQLDHPTLRHIYSIRRIKRWLSLREIHVMMEFCQGETVQTSRPSSVAQAVGIFLEIASALAYMNARGFVHADTKPNNIIVDSKGGVKIIDFGQSCTMGTVKPRIQGTPDFIAPEQVHRRPLDARTDVFNFGASLYWTVTGRPIPTVLPKEGSLTLENGPKPLPARKFNPDVPEALEKLIADCIEVSPPSRPASMNEVASRLSLIGRQFSGTGGNGS